jgi:Holliday junction resolvase-like predicted endonuclease
VVANAQRGYALEQAFARWLSEQGWTVTTSALSAPVAIDILADRPGEPPLVVEVKTALRSGAQALRQVQRLKDAAQRQAWGEQVRFAVALGERPPDGVLEKLRAVGVEVYVQSGDGFTHLV